MLKLTKIIATLRVHKLQYNIFGVKLIFLNSYKILREVIIEEAILEEEMHTKFNCRHYFDLHLFR